MSGPGLRVRPAALLGALVAGVLLVLALVGGSAVRPGGDALRTGRVATASTPVAAPASTVRARPGTSRLATAPASARAEHPAPASAVTRVGRTAPVLHAAPAGLLPGRRGPPTPAFVVVLPDRPAVAAAAVPPSPHGARAPPTSA